MKILDRILLLLTALLSAYLIVVSIEGLNSLAMISYTIAFGVLLIASLLIIIMGWEILDSPLIVIISTIIPFSLSLGLISEYLHQFTIPYLLFVIFSLIAISITQYKSPKKVSVPILAITHGIAGLIIFFIPIISSINGVTNPGFIFVGIGGAVIGLGGLLLSFTKSGVSILSYQQILSFLPWILMFMSLFFVLGFRLA